VDDYNFVLQTESRKPVSSRSVYFSHDSMAIQGLLHFPTSCKKKKKLSSSVKNVIGNFKAIALNM